MHTLNTIGLSNLAKKQQSTWQLISAPPRLQQATVAQRASQAALARSGPAGSSASKGGSTASAAATASREAARTAGRSDAVTSPSSLPVSPIDNLNSVPSSSAATAWAEKYAPRSLEELLLALNSKKVQEVQDWLEHQKPDRFRREYCRLMIVTGASDAAAGQGGSMPGVVQLANE